MAGFIKTEIDFSALQKTLDAAKSLSEADEKDAAKNILQKMAEKINKEISDN